MSYKSSLFENVTLVDLTHSLDAVMPSWDGHCGFQHNLRKDYDLQAEFQFRTYDIKMQAGMGTHIDAPLHCFSEGQSVEEMSLKSLFAPCVVLDVSKKAHERYSLTVDDVHEFESRYGALPTGCFVIIYSGWDKYWKTPEQYRNNLVFPSISKEAAQELINRQIVGLGIDTLSPDRPEDGYFVHQLILGAEKYIIENVANASSLPAIGSYILALPLKIKEATEAPMRLIAVLLEQER
jgi:kynurenine formamidase